MKPSLHPRRAHHLKYLHACCTPPKSLLQKSPPEKVSTCKINCKCPHIFFTARLFRLYQLAYQNFLLICTEGCAFCWSLLNKLSPQLLWIHCIMSICTHMCVMHLGKCGLVYLRAFSTIVLHCSRVLLHKCSIEQLLRIVELHQNWCRVLCACGAPDLTRICGWIKIKLHPLNL